MRRPISEDHVEQTTVINILSLKSASANQRTNGVKRPNSRLDEQVATTKTASLDVTAGSVAEADVDVVFACPEPSPLAWTGTYSRTSPVTARTPCRAHAQRIASVVACILRKMCCRRVFILALFSTLVMF